MTATLSRPRPPTSTPAGGDAAAAAAAALRDAVATGAAGLVALLAADVDLGRRPRAAAPRRRGRPAGRRRGPAVASRWSGRRLRLATTVCAELALAWVVATGVVLAVHDLPVAGVEVLGAVGLVTLGFGVTELRALRRR